MPAPLPCRGTGPGGTGPGALVPVPAAPGPGRTARRPAPAGRAGEGLRDGHPLPRGGAGDDQPGVGAVPPLGDHQAEIEGGAADPVGGVPRPPGPRAAVGRRELDPDGGVRPWQAVHGVAVGQAGHPEMRDVPQPAGRRTLDVQGVGDVLAVRPGLHQPGRDRGRGAHVQPVPGQPGGGIGVRVARQEVPAGAPEPAQQVRGAEVAVLGGDLVGEVAAPAGQRLGVAAEQVRVTDRQQGRLVEVGQVADLIGDGPAHRGRGELPLAGRERPEDRVQRDGLGHQVRGERAEVGGHQRPVQTGRRLSRKAAGPSCASALWYTGSQIWSASA